ncbi:MFS transporter [Demequina sp. SYSU T00192]|uniref:MFS transporter n=1 Tax=Demequina litoralis TaxID=3051660 RepID=A0ABT8G9D1_9MICO|nr:MFS transporter [Demequina sp. SYSU T00192]MDN4475750.1 MFS transporter [Demequina sp. SYSU T00192]
MNDPLTRTLELDPLGPLLDREEPATTTHDLHLEAEPTTLTIPVVGGGEAIVVDEPEAGYRSTAALTLSPRRAGLALSALALGAFATGANEASIVALSANIARGLGAPVSQVGLLATAFALTVVLAAIPLTVVTRRLSKRVALSATFGVWTVGLVLAASAAALPQLAAGRIVSAAAHALFWAIVAPTAASLFAPHLRARSVTRIMVGAAAAGVVGTPLITVAGGSLGWQAPYWAFAALGVLLAVALALLLPGSAPARRGASDPTDSPVEHHATGDLPSMRAFVRVLVVTFAASVAMTTTWTYIVPFYTDVAEVGTRTVPILFALGGTVAVGTTLAVTPYLATHAVPTVAFGLVVLSVAWTLLATGLGWAAVAGQVAQAAGWAVLLAALLNWAMRHSPWRSEVGASTYTVAMNSGAAVGPLVGGLLVEQHGLRDLPVVSLALTLLAAGVTAGVDRTMLRRLRVPRHVRLALEARDAMRARRQEWQRRTGAAVGEAIGTAGQGAARAADRGARRAGSALRSHVRDWAELS